MSNPTPTITSVSGIRLRRKERVAALQAGCGLVGD
jgi:hypothetical protein